MINQVKPAFSIRNPDVLSCISNLSSDEVFTPPELAKRILNDLDKSWQERNGGKSLWSEKDVKFLDSCVKSGIFLREITLRLIDGLESQIADLNERVEHILTNQIYGIGITNLTSLLSRRSVYCSKDAKSSHSIAKSFPTSSGNIWYSRTEHAWVRNASNTTEDLESSGKCQFCGAPRNTFDRDASLENHAYALIHSHDAKKMISDMFGGEMQFDVIIGNPPYQMTGGAGGTSDSSIYHLFVNQAISLDPKLLCMVIPSRWMAGGRGLDEFRNKMLSEGHLRSLTDYPDSSEAFPGVQIKGGICYFLYDSGYIGDCTVTRVTNGVENIQTNRKLGEFDVFVRDERALSILRKVLARSEPSVVDLISGDTPFGIPTNYSDYTEKKVSGFIELHLINKSKREIAYIKRSEIRKNANLIDSWKLLVPKAYGAGENYPHQILGKEIIAPPPSVCTQSYLTIAPFSTEAEAVSFSSYYRTRIFRFLVSLRKITQDALRSTYKWVPCQKWDMIYTDEFLYAKYGISDMEQEYIATMIRAMDGSND